jgi:3'-5' exoribonuclease
MIEDKLRGIPDFPPRLRDLVEHMILSHHGQMEFGSPKVPLFAEAVLLHYLDDMDSKMECVRSLVARDRQVEGDWTGYSAPLDRVILKKCRYLNGDAAAAEPEAEAPPHPPAAPAERPKQVTLFGEKLIGALKPSSSPEDT